MKITDTIKTPIQLPPKQAKEAGKTTETKHETPPAVTTAISKQGATVNLSYPVNQKKVDEIKSAISEGRFKVDASKIADGLINSVKDLIKSHK